MKEFIKTNTITYNLMSFTGFKSLVLFSLLKESPKTYEEIRTYFQNHKYIKEDISLDALRVYITSLKRVGCTIERKKTPQGGKYYITSHPFEFKISDEQVKSLIKIYRIINNTVDISDLFLYENFLRKLAANTKNDNLNTAIDKISIFKSYDYELIDDLIKYSKAKRKITILYDSPTSGLKEIKVLANKLDISEGKIYLCGVSLEYNQQTSYILNRIQKIVDVDLTEENSEKLELKPTIIGYELSTLTPNCKLSEDEKIVEIKENSIIVEFETTNLFAAKRRILGYGELCTVLYPEDFRNNIIDTLKSMQEEYING